MAGTIVVDRLESDASYASSINIASPVIVSNTFAFPAGSASAPAISPSGDTNTGIFFPAADTIAFAEGGTEGMRLDANGNMGIGTTNPTDTSLFTRALDLNGTSGAAYYARTNGSATNYTAFGNFGVDGYINNRGAGNIQFYTNGNVERMRITSDGLLQFNSGYGSIATAYGCRAWVNFNGTGTVAIRASGNVSSITDNGTGDYTVNFSNSMPDVNYSVSGSAAWTTAGWGNVFGMDSAATSTTSFRIKSIAMDGNAYTLNDTQTGSVQVFR
jgi:hypothetical protein